MCAGFPPLGGITSAVTKNSPAWAAACRREPGVGARELEREEKESDMKGDEIQWRGDSVGDDIALDV